MFQDYDLADSQGVGGPSDEWIYGEAMQLKKIMIPTREELCRTPSHTSQLWTRPTQL